MTEEELIVLTQVWTAHIPPRAGDIHHHDGQDYRITGFLPAQRDVWFNRSVTLTLEAA